MKVKRYRVTCWYLFPGMQSVTSQKTAIARFAAEMTSNLTCLYNFRFQKGRQPNTSVLFNSAVSCVEGRWMNDLGTLVE